MCRGHLLAGDDGPRATLSSNLASALARVPPALLDGPALMVKSDGPASGRKKRASGGGGGDVHGYLAAGNVLAAAALLVKMDHTLVPPVPFQRQRLYLSKSVDNGVVQKPIRTKIRQLILYISNSIVHVDGLRGF